MDLVSEILAWFKVGGLVMYPLLLCSFLVMAIAFERFYAFKLSTANSEKVLKSLQEYLAAGQWQAAAEVCAASPNMLARILQSGLTYRDNITSMRQAFEEKTMLEAATLRKNLGYLDVIVTMAPLLGLLGTVIGMIGSFRVLDVAGNNPAAITGGVGEALVATASGLTVAVLALVVHTYFSHRLDSLLTDIENACVYVVSAARGIQA